jgi:hypothetical protein
MAGRSLPGMSLRMSSVRGAGVSPLTPSKVRVIDGKGVTTFFGNRPTRRSGLCCYLSSCLLLHGGAHIYRILGRIPRKEGENESLEHL